MKQNAQNGHLSSRPRRLRLVPSSSQETMGEYLEKWLRGRRSLRPATVRSYEVHVRRHILPHIGHVPLAKISVAHLDAMFEALLDPDQNPTLSVATVHRVHATLHCALNGAVKQGLIERNPASLVELPAVMHARTAPWSADELATFLNLTVDDPLHALFALLGLRGLRRGEALGLRWRSVDLDQRTILVEEQLTFYNGVVVFGPPKSKSGRRLVAIDETSRRDAVSARLSPDAHSQDRTAGQVEDDTCVFTDDNGATPEAGLGDATLLHPCRRARAASYPPARPAAHVSLDRPRERRDAAGGQSPARSLLGVDHRRHLLRHRCGNRARLSRTPGGLPAPPVVTHARTNRAQPPWLGSCHVERNHS